jgi:hypothetical protein
VAHAFDPKQKQRRWFFAVLASLPALGLAVACSGSPLDFGRSCTEVGCLTFVRIELAFASGLTRDDIQVVVEHDGKSFSCDFGADSDPCHRGFAPGFDPVRTTGTSDAGRAVILLDEAPPTLRITVTSAGGSETQIVEPVYVRSQPNGPDCPPTCSSASVLSEFAL